MADPLEIIRKLLALAKGGTEHEAALAAQRASEIALKYNISLLDVQEKDEGPRRKEDTAFTSKKREQWIMNIIRGLCYTNACKCYFEEKWDDTMMYRVVGRQSAVDAVQLTTEYLIGEVRRLNREYVSQHNLSQQERSQYRKDFRLNCSQRLQNRLWEKYEALKKSTDNTELKGTNALVIANYFETEKKEIDLFLKDMGVTFSKPKYHRTRETRSEIGASDGRRAGNSISLDQQVGGSSNAVRRLK